MQHKRRAGGVGLDCIAMKNSNLPETQEISAKMMAACDSEPTFRNLDVIQEDIL